MIVRLLQILAIARTDLTLVLRDRQNLLWLFVMPLIFIYTFGRANFGDDAKTTEKSAIPVAMEDTLFLGEAFTKELEDRTWVGETHAEGDSLLEARGSWIVVPRGLTRTVLSGGRDSVEVVSKRGASARRAESYAWSARKAAIRVLLNLQGVPDSLRANGADSVFMAAYDSVAALPPLVELEVRSASRARPIPRGYLLSVPGNLVMFVLIVALTAGAADIAVDVRQGHIRRLGACPLSKLDIFTGKLAGRLLTSLVQILFLMAVSTLLFDMRWGNDPTALALLFLVYAITAATIGIFIGLVVGKADTAASLGVLVTLTLSALGGCWWPLEIVPDGMKKLAHIFPTAWALEGLHTLISYGGSLGDVALNITVLTLYAAAFAYLASRLLRFDR